MFKKIKDKIRQQSKKKRNVKVARAEGYANGSEDASRELTKQLKSLNIRISHLTEENLKIEESLRLHYEERTSLLESRYTEKCKQCMSSTESERDRLRKNQNMILDLIQKFNIVFMKVFKHTSLVADEHDNIIKSSGRVKSSRETLLSIKSEADKIIQKAIPLTSIFATENSLQNDVEYQLPTNTETKANCSKTKDKSHK